MSKKTNKFPMLPWLKGLNTCIDEGIMHLLNKGDFIIQADNIVYDLDGSKTKREGFGYFDSAAITNTPTIRGGYDYWANVSSVKTQKIVVVDGQATSKIWFQAAGGGAYTELTKHAAATAPTSVTRVAFEVFNDDLIMAVTSANGTTPKKWNNQTGTEYEELGGSPPSIKFVRTHQGRIWGAGDPARPDRLYFTSPGNHEEWNGAGDSGALDIDPGDGDTSGITAIFPSFKGRLIVAKGSRLYQITGTTPEDYKSDPISKGIGCISHNSCVAVDLDDIYFMSDRGFHSLTVTEKYGDFEGMFVSSDIQVSFNSWDKDLLQYSQGVWIPTLNSIMWTVSEGGTNLDKIWLYDVRFKAWYRWTGVNPTALFRVQDTTSKIKKAYFGNTAGRISYVNNGSYHDYTNTAISQTLKTPYIYPDGNPITVKGFKKLGVWVVQDTDVDLTVDVLVTGQTTAQTLTFSSSGTGGGRDTLDNSFILGTSVLDQASAIKMTPLCLPIDGYSTSLTLTFTQATVDKYSKIFGFWIEWEPAGDSQETVGF